MGVDAELRGFVLAHQPWAGSRHADAGVPTAAGFGSSSCVAAALSSNGG